ncbi:MAG TPA: 5-oxoprolinase subunit PxpA [Nitrospiraceae bacterium]|nr:5-oxoprolinase subunit PxpA [Nitrospiraceae bacterium]
MLTRIDLNSDMGERDTPEGWAIDAEMMPLITSVNIACGGHAGTPDLMRRTAQLAMQHGVAIGAHPGLPDREHLGRRERSIACEESRTLVISQIETLADVLARDHLALTHVKPHGALYNMAASNPEVARAIVHAVQAVDRTFLLYALAGSELVKAAQAAGLTVAQEAFADRAYRADGTLVPRSEHGSILQTEQDIRRRLHHLMASTVMSVDGASVPIHADTLCLHADTSYAVPLARMIRQEFESAGIRLAAVYRE